VDEPRSLRALVFAGLEEAWRRGELSKHPLRSGVDSKVEENVSAQGVAPVPDAHHLLRGWWLRQAFYAC
jgi:hypothetical protein